MALSLTQFRIKESEVFVPCGYDVVELIEATSDGLWTKHYVNNEFVEQYVEKDYGGIKSLSSNETTVNTTVEHLKLFFSTQQKSSDDTLLPVPMSLKLYKRIAPFARIPTIYPSVLYRNAAMSTYCMPLFPDKMAHRTGHDEYLSFILYSTISSAQQIHVGVSFTYNFKDHHMYVFMHGRKTEYWQDLYEAIRSGAARENYFLIPALIIQINLQEQSKNLQSWTERIRSHEREVGTRWEVEGPRDPTWANGPRMIEDVSKTQTNVAFVAWQVTTIQRQLDFMDSVAYRYRERAPRNGHSEQGAEEVKSRLVETHDYLRAWSIGLQDRTEYLSKRGNALVQFLYNAIAQRDAAIGLKLSTTSTHLAESSQVVALATAQDSAVMRVIAAITIFFLPATFTATFFSTSFFDFHGGPDDKIYSWWIWLYFLLTIILTVIVVAGTYLFWKQKVKETQERRRDIKSRDEKATNEVASSTMNTQADRRQSTQDRGEVHADRFHRDRAGAEIGDQAFDRKVRLWV